ncbi:DnaJ C-terminal domain-containing protein [Demequina sp.]|uniref:DnaJ C-terminal domain-containing protein n=1 Tax=Demequina sp. TaxID=2050685 RepID=UPI003D14E9EE
MASQDWFSKDFYATLGVPKDADAAAVKKAYRQLAKELHPDRNPGNAQAEQRFKDVGEAYAVLSDAEQRKQYDAVRAMGGGGPRFQAGGSGGSQGFEDVFGGMFGGAGAQQAGSAGFDDILSQMFGGGARRGPQKGPDIAAVTEVSFREAAQGATVTLGLDGQRVSTRIPVGVQDGQKIRVPGKGRAGANGGPPGDLLLTVRVGKHPVFSYDGLNLRVQVPVTYAEAALGATIQVPTLTGDKVSVKVPGGTPSGQILRVKGRGLTSRDKTGDLHVAIVVDVPRKLSRHAKQAVEALAEQLSDNPRDALYKDASK